MVRNLRLQQSSRLLAVRRGGKPVLAVWKENQAKSSYESPRKRIKSANLSAVQNRFYFEPHLFNRIEIRIVWWKIERDNFLIAQLKCTKDRRGFCILPKPSGGRRSSATLTGVKKWQSTKDAIMQD